MCEFLENLLNSPPPHLPSVDYLSEWLNTNTSIQTTKRFIESDAGSIVISGDPLTSDDLGITIQSAVTLSEKDRSILIIWVKIW